MREITICRNESGGRFDKYLMKYMNVAPHGFIYKMIRKKRIKLNGARAEGNEILSEGDVITLYLSDDTIASFSGLRAQPAQTGELDIIFEDDDILLVNKPAGMLVHSDTPNGGDDLTSRLVYYLDQKGLLTGTFTPAPSNRLDRNTSGIVVCGKNPAAVRALNAAKSEKCYLAVVLGKVDESAQLTGYIDKDPQNNEAIVSDKQFPGSKSIVTEYTPIGWGDGITLLSIKLVTGRTHQIRAQLKAAGIPILGDPKYGDLRVNKKLGLKHQLLHAAGYSFLENTGVLEKHSRNTFWAPVPEKFIKLLKGFIYESHYLGSRLCYEVIPINTEQTKSTVESSREGHN